MPERTLTISSIGKTFSVTGWKTGWATGPAELVAAVRAAKQFLTFAGGTPFQYASAAALRLNDAWYAEFSKDLKVKRDHLCAALAQAGLKVLVPQGTYFANVEIDGDGAQWCRELVPQGRRRGDPDLGLLHRSRAAEALRALRVLQAARGDRRGRRQAQRNRRSSQRLSSRIRSGG